jgi:crotonobetainyl-CoA:carnitine CoA-transferase CaiB-like acyl-CoA transferase
MLFAGRTSGLYSRVKALPRARRKRSPVLEGIKVIELGQLAAIPACGQILADLGAEVIKVEASRGDISRDLGPVIGNGMGPFYMSLNRGKRSVRADVRQGEGGLPLRRLMLSADAVITNLDRRSLREAGLDAASLRREQPRLVYLEISGYDSEGPAATDSLIQEAMGMTSVTGPTNGEPYRCGAIVVDMSTSIWAALGVVSALYRRDRTGAGEHVEISLADAALFLQTSNLAVFREDPRAMRRRGNHSNLTCTPMLTASDGRIGVSLLHDRHWREFCREVDCPELIDDPRFATNELRTAAQGLIERIVNPVIYPGTRAVWIERLTARRVPCAPERGYDEVLRDASLWQRGSLYEQTVDGSERKVLQTRLPLFFEAADLAAPRPAPELGEATKEILGPDQAGAGWED